MPSIAVTGHMDLTPATVSLVDTALRALLSDHQDADLIGVTCLAKGADQLFARAVLDLGGQLIVVLPSSNYRKQKVRPNNRVAFRDLLAESAAVRSLPEPAS